MSHAIELRDVRKTFGANVAVDGVSLVVPRGAVYGVIGPSGAGKTTCIRMIMYLVIFFLITYFLFASVFGAIGAAVNEMREAQALVTPVMLVLMVPWLLVAPVARDPNTTMAIALSFIPPVNTLAMMIRMASTSPPPLWQVWVTIGVGLAAACGVTWMAAKIFRVGLLMYGKPPNFATLLRWARQS